MAHSLTAGKAQHQMFMRKGPENQDVTVKFSLKWRNGALSYSRKGSTANIHKERSGKSRLLQLNLA